MIGCIGIGPAGAAISCGTPGCHGGNKVIGRGARVYLPVNVPGALSWIVDVHATQGNDSAGRAGAWPDYPRAVDRNAASANVHRREPGSR